MGTTVVDARFETWNLKLVFNMRKNISLLGNFPKLYMEGEHET